MTDDGRHRRAVNPVASSIRLSPPTTTSRDDRSAFSPAAVGVVRFRLMALTLLLCRFLVCSRAPAGITIQFLPGRKLKLSDTITASARRRMGRSLYCGILDPNGSREHSL
jgi:hypothetical protein